MKRRSWLAACVFVAVLVPSFAARRGRQTACVSRPAMPVAERWAAAAARARVIVCEKLAPEIPGLAIAVAVDGQLVWSEAFGYADLEAKRPATPATQFRIGSVSTRDSRVVFALVTNLSDASLAPAQQIRLIFDSLAQRSNR